MSDPLVQELRERATGFSLGDAGVALSQLLRRAADALDAAHQREQAQLFLLATVKRLLLQKRGYEALQELAGVDAAADLKRAAAAQGEPR